MSLDYQNPNSSVNQIYPFQQQLGFQNPNHILLPCNETEFLSYDSFQFDDPLFNPPPFDFSYDQNDKIDDFIIPYNTNNTPFDFIEHPPPMYFPKEEVLSVDQDYTAQFHNFPKKQRHENYLPCFAPDFSGDVMMNEQSNSNYYNYYNCNSSNNNNVEYGVFNDGYGETHDNIKVTKGKEISAQSKAARERRRKITEKTHALSKMIPGANRMNTAEMFQAAFKYVKFMQAQLLILQSIKTLQQVFFTQLLCSSFLSFSSIN